MNFLTNKSYCFRITNYVILYTVVLLALTIIFEGFLPTKAQFLVLFTCCLISLIQLHINTFDNMS